MRKSFFYRLGNRITIHGGMSERFGIGICIHKYGIDLDIGPFWILLEWWFKP